MKKVIYLFIVLIFHASCYPIRFTWSDKSPGELWKVIPNSINECMTRLDTLFSEKGKKHFSEMKESIAVIEVCQQMDDGFIYGWNLIPNAEPVNKKKKERDQFYDKFPQLSNFSDLSCFFNQVGITDPKEMIRIIFTCYHRKLNNIDFDIMSVIDEYKSFWISSTIYSRNGKIDQNANWKLNNNIKWMEDSLLNKYFFDRINLNDTMTSSFFYGNFKFNSKPSLYNIEGKVENKDSVKSTLRIRITGIFALRKASLSNDSVWYDNENIRRIGEEIENSAQFWYKKNEPRFYYRSSSMYEKPKN